MANELHVGVNLLALDEERLRQETFFEGIRALEDQIRRVSSSNNIPVQIIDVAVSDL